MTTTPHTVPTHQPAQVGQIPRTTALHMLRQIYAQLPTVECQGLCHDSCTIVGASQLERDVLAAHGITLSNKSPRMVIAERDASPDGMIDTRCPALSIWGKCTVYRDRPFICRAFGAVSNPYVTGPARFEQAMMCDHGCEPSATMSIEQFMLIMSEIEALSRVATGIARQPIPGDSATLTGMFQRDHLAERAGFQVGPEITRHASEGQPASVMTRKKGKRKSRRRGDGRPRSG